MASTLERDFHNAMLEIYRRAASECNYRPTRFQHMVNERGGLQAAKDLLKSERHSEGLTTLWEHNKLSISMEALVLQPRWRSLFTEVELAVAQKRLSELGYDPTTHHT